MVSSTVLAGLLGFVGTVATGYILAGLWVWRHRSNLDGDDEDRIEQLENDQLSNFEAELSNLYLDIERLAEESEQPEEVPRDEHIVEIISRNVDREDVAAVAEELEKIGEIKEMYEKHETAFDKCYNCLFHAGGAAILLGIILVVSIVTDGGPFSALPLVAYTLTLAYMLERSQASYNHFQRANDIKEEFTQCWRSYKSPD